MEYLERYKSHILLALVFAIVFGGYVLSERRPQPAPIEIIDPTPAATVTPVAIRVHVVGAVWASGVYSLPAGSRWLEAVEAAGGLTGAADVEMVNLADHLHDGQQIRIPLRGATAPPGPTSAAAPRVSAPETSGRPGSLVNINSATAPELDELPGIGPTYAARIIAYRQEHGRFVETIEIMQVKGIGPACYDRIKDLIATD